MPIRSSPAPAPAPDHARRAAAALLLLGLAACGGDAPPPGDGRAANAGASLDGTPTAVLEAAERRLAEGDLEGVLALLEDRERTSLEPRARLLLAVALHKSQRHGAAEPLYAAALADGGELANRAGWIHMHAQCLLQLGRLEQARARFEQHAALDPAEGDTPLGLGRIALAEGRLEDARGHLRRAADLHRAATAAGRADRREQEGRALAWLGDVELAADDPLAARAALERSVQVFPWSRGAWTKLHAVALTLGDADLAERALAGRAELDRRAAEARAAAGEASGSGGDR